MGQLRTFFLCVAVTSRSMKRLELEGVNLSGISLLTINEMSVELQHINFADCKMTSHQLIIMLFTCRSMLDLNTLNLNKCCMAAIPPELFNCISHVRCIHLQSAAFHHLQAEAVFSDLILRSD